MLIDLTKEKQNQRFSNRSLDDIFYDRLKKIKDETDLYLPIPPYAALSDFFPFTVFRIAFGEGNSGKALELLKTSRAIFGFQTGERIFVHPDAIITRWQKIILKLFISPQDRINAAREISVRKP